MRDGRAARRARSTTATSAPRAGVEAVHAIVPSEELYRRNGLQFLPFNTLYQLRADRTRARWTPPTRSLLIPDLFALLADRASRVAERTNASTTGLVDVATRQLGRRR